MWSRSLLQEWIYEMGSKCKVCGMNQTEGDRREKYPESVRNAAIAIYC
jgi:hypothetical protein